MTSLTSCITVNFLYSDREVAADFQAAGFVSPWSTDVNPLSLASCVTDEKSAATLNFLMVVNLFSLPGIS